MSLAAIRDLLECEVLACPELLGTEISTVVAADGMSVVLTALCRRAFLVTGLANIQAVRTAHVADLAAILFVRGVRPNEKTIDHARQRSIAILATRLGMFDCCGILRNQGLRGVT